VQNKKECQGKHPTDVVTDKECSYAFNMKAFCVRLMIKVGRAGFTVVGALAQSKCGDPYQ
jgi:hypothetical protein